jgi:ABC-type Na+ efflux pump permease subunit
MKPIRNLTLPRIYRHLAVFSTLMILLILVSALPAKAQSSFLDQLQQIIRSLQTYITQYKREFSRQWEELSGDLEDAINSTVGDLGIPDPLEAGKKIKVIIQEQDTDLIETDSQTQGDNAQRQWNQSYTYGLSESVLGREGQQTQAQEAEMSNYALETSSNSTDAIQNDIITQDILKKMAVQNLQTTIITKSIHSEAQKQTRALSAANINLSDISSRLDEQARKEQANNNSSARQIIDAAVFADAFWEKNND